MPKLKSFNSPEILTPRKPLRRIAGVLGIFMLTSCSVPDIQADPIDKAYKQELIQLIQESNSRSESFWSNEIYGVGPAAPPDSEIKLTDNGVSWKCDLAAPDERQELFYCPVEGSKEIVVNPDAFAALMKTVGDDDLSVEEQTVLVDTVIAHEFGHKLQDYLYPGGFQRLVQQFGILALERQADCLAGVGLSAFPIKLIDLEMAVTFMNKLGASEYTQPGESRAHGTPEQRMNDLVNGFNQGRKALLTKNPPSVTSTNPLRYCDKYTG